ncbi:hypothetical protein Tco_1152542 [Tanacetum coccineum]
MIGTRPLLHNKTQDIQALKFKDQSHKRDLNESSKIKVMQAYDAISPPQVTIPLPTVVPPSLVLSLPPMFDSQDFFPPEEISLPKDTETSPSSSVGSS